MLVSAVIVNWNGANDLPDCLSSLLQQRLGELEMEILVVDNGSTDASEEIARSFAVQWLNFGRNAGLAAAANCGARLARGELLLFLNNDMRFDPDFVRRLASELIKDKRTFAVDARQYAWDGHSAVHAAAVLMNHTSGSPKDEIKLLPGLYATQVNCSDPRPVMMGSAANLMVNRSKFELLGGFDERLPLGYEDTDLCWRAWIAGWGTQYVPSAICWHKLGSASGSAEGRSLRTVALFLGRLVVATKLLPLRYVIATLCVTTLGALRDALRLNPGAVWQRGSALSRWAVYTPSLIRERRSLYRCSGTTPGVHLRRLLELGWAIRNHPTS